MPQPNLKKSTPLIFNVEKQYYRKNLEQVIIHMRRHPARWVMVDTLDQRINRQRDLVEKILQERNLSINDLLSLSLSEISSEDLQLQLCYHVLRDCGYIDNLR